MRRSLDALSLIPYEYRAEFIPLPIFLSVMGSLIDLVIAACVYVSKSTALLFPLFLCLLCVLFGSQLWSIRGPKYGFLLSLSPSF